ncbi:MAG TPA: hypothetical protein ACFYED_00225 [Candidatus Tripitaka californicus]|uniref:hypothetical protein n=1 Tax=Candidatus Tripitaka californicus TaxID=3367616 RepID=UPI00402607F8
MIVKLVDESGAERATDILKPVAFKTGSVGLRAVFKGEWEGKKYQVNVQAVQIGSKPATAPAPAKRK